MAFKVLAPALFAALVVGAPAFAADYQTNLGPMPLDDETKAVIAGRGEATATSDGKTLTVKGAFHGLPSNATEAHIFVSPKPGMPGTKISSSGHEGDQRHHRRRVQAHRRPGHRAAQRQALHPDQQRAGAGFLSLGPQRHAMGLAVPGP